MKLGCLTFKFTHELFNNKGEFNIDYYEKIIDITSSFTKNLNSPEISKLSSLIVNKEKLLNTFNVGYRNIQDKKTSIGYMFIYDIIQAFCSLESQSESLYNTSLLDTKNFLEQNFYNYKKFLTSRLKNNKKDVTPSSDKLENKGYYINYQQIELIASKNNNKHYLCLPQLS